MAVPAARGFHEPQETRPKVHPPGCPEPGRPHRSGLPDRDRHRGRHRRGWRGHAAGGHHFREQRYQHQRGRRGRGGLRDGHHSLQHSRHRSRPLLLPERQYRRSGDARQRCRDRGPGRCRHCRHRSGLPPQLVFHRPRLRPTDDQWAARRGRLHAAPTPTRSNLSWASTRWCGSSSMEPMPVDQSMG
jgi:hypothetical protein